MYRFKFAKLGLLIFITFVYEASAIEAVSSSGQDNHDSFEPQIQMFNMMRFKRDLNKNTENPINSLLHAVRTQNLKTVQDELNKGAVKDVNTLNPDGLNALHIAARYGPVEIVQELLSRGALPNVPSLKKKNIAIHPASLAGQSDIVKALLKAGADYDAQNLNGFTPLYMAAQEGHVACVRLLLEAGANISIAVDGFTPLAVAIQQNKSEVVGLLIRADPRSKAMLSPEETAIILNKNKEKP